MLYFRVIVFAIILLSMPMLGTAESGKDRFHILLLNSYHPELSWTHNVIGGFQKEIRQCGLDVELTCEYLDSRRYPQLQSSMQNLIRQKLQNQQPDIVVVSDNDAFQFALRNRSTVFQDIPIVFCGINDFTPSMIEEDTNLTGVAEDQSILGTIRLALRLHPQTERIIVIGRTRVLADRANRAAFMDRLEEIKKLTQVSFWDDYSAENIAARLKTLDPHTLIVLNGLMEDKQGREMMYADTTRWVRRHSALPIYSFWEVYLGHGIVGGKLVSGRNQGHLAARLAMRILQGESAEHIPVVRGENANRYIFDAKELRRFKIPHSALPRDAKIINRPLTFYQKNKEWIWGISLFILLQFAIISFLIFNLARRMRAEKALKDSEALYSSLVTNLPLCIFRKDMNGCFTYVNQHFCQLIGKTHDEILGKTDFDLHEKELAEKYHSDDRMILRRQKTFETVEQNDLGEESRFVHVIKTPVYDASNKLIGLQGIFWDITKRVKAERELHDYQERLALALDAAKIGFWDWDVLSGDLFWDTRNYEMLGYKPNEFPLSQDRCRNITHPEDQTATRERENEVVKHKKRFYQAEMRLATKEGGWRWVCSRGKPVAWDTQGNPTRIIGTLMDISDQKRLEEQLFQSKKMEAIGRLAGGVAHDFNNLLTAILGYCDLSRKRLPQDDPVRKLIGEINNAGTRAQSLTAQLLAYSRKQILQPKVIDLNELLYQLDDMLSRLVGETIQMEVMTDPTVGKVKADPGQLQQVIVNLVVNARDAMPKGGKITLETQNCHLDENYAQHHLEVTPGPYILLAVSDTGSGMDKSTLDKIFEPFFTTKEQGKGTGMGLSMVHGIIKQSHGHLSVYSEMGKGTTVKIYLPRTEALQTQEVSQPRTDIDFSGTETVLVVEDEDMVREMILTVLEEEGYSVLSARNSVEAMQQIHSADGPIHMLISDVILPQKTGVELAQEMKQFVPGIHVLFISGYTENSIVHHGILDEGIHFLQKPFTPDGLLGKIRSILDETD